MNLTFPTGSGALTGWKHDPTVVFRIQLAGGLEPDAPWYYSCRFTVSVRP